MLGPFCTTNWGRSTAAGIEIGPTNSAKFAGEVPLTVDVELSEQNFDGAEAQHTAAINAISETHQVEVLVAISRVWRAKESCVTSGRHHFASPGLPRQSASGCSSR
jgi:hypothetical protein